MNRILLLASVLALAAVSARAARPTVSLTGFAEADDGTVEIAYALTGGPAIVTADIQTNGDGNAWTSVGGLCLRTLNGDVNRVVSKETGEATWNPRNDLQDARFDIGAARVVLKAWPTNDPPDYMIVSLEANPISRVEYFERADLIPGGLLENTTYRASCLAFRRIHAKGVKWTMGSVGENGRETNEIAHDVRLDHDYWMGIFEITRVQYAKIIASSVSGGLFPAKNVAYDTIRGSASSSFYPNPPSSGSVLGKLKSITGIDFDLPGEAEWEFAARAGHGEAMAGDGVVLTSAHAKEIAYYGHDWSSTYCGIESGDRKPNDFGLYDTVGNEREWCVDWYQTNISSLNDGCINANGANRTDGTAGSTRVLKGGCFSSAWDGCRPAWRSGAKSETCGHENGFRFASRYGLE